MSQLIVANVAAPFVLSQTGSIWLFVSIIPVETLVVFLCLKFSGIAINFFRLFIAVLMTNITTSMLGIFLLSGPGSASIGVISLYLLIGFMFSFSIEAVIYARIFEDSSFELTNCQIILFSFLSNLASYIIFVSALTSLDYHNGGSPVSIPNSSRVVRVLRDLLPDYMRMQEISHYEKGRFADNWQELDFALKETSFYTLYHKFYRLDIQGDATTANFTATSKRKDLKSYRLTIFKDNDTFIQGTCETNLPSMTAPEIPLLVGGKVQCPPGSSETSDHFKWRGQYRGGAISWKVERDMENYISLQRNLYDDKNRLANNWEELKFPYPKETKYGSYRYDFQGDATKANFTATSKRKNFTSYRVTIFIVQGKDNNKFIRRICETDKPSMTAPKIPQLVSGEFQCPPGSSDLR
jgi:Type IV pilin-like G and H, putative